MDRSQVLSHCTTVGTPVLFLDAILKNQVDESSQNFPKKGFSVHAGPWQQLVAQGPTPAGLAKQGTGGLSALKVTPSAS